MAWCPAYSAPICSLCCSLDSRCHDMCKPQCKAATPQVGEVARAILPAQSHARKLSHAPRPLCGIDRVHGLISRIGCILAMIAHQVSTASPEWRRHPAIAHRLLRLRCRRRRRLLVLCAGP
jgi:hypothetical protein